MVEFSITSCPGEADALSLGHADLPYAGKFGRTATGTALLRDGSMVIAALSFSPDRTDHACCRIRYLATARDRQGEGLAGRLVEAFTDWASGTGYERVRITAVNPYALIALDRAGFGYTGIVGPTGGAVMEWPDDACRSLDSALETLSERTLTAEQHRYIQRYLAKIDTA